MFMRIQFIRGLKDNWIREQLLLSEFSDFDELLKKATSLEASRIESGELRKYRPSTDECSVDTSRLSNASKPFSRHISRSRSSCRSPERFPDSRFSSKSQTRDRPNRKINYRDLGIEGLCFNCSKPNHRSKECRVDRSRLRCSACGKVGHVARVCFSSLMKDSNGSTFSTKTISKEDDEASDSESIWSYGITHVNFSDVREVTALDKYYITVTLNGKPQQFEVDSGAKYSLLSETDFIALELDVPIQPTKVSFRSYSDHVIIPKGKVSITVKYKDYSTKAELFIVPTGYDALLGRVWIRSLGINLQEIDEERLNAPTSNPICSLSTDDIFSQYAPIFEEKIGCVPNFEVKFQLRPDAKPVYIRERNVPFALLDKVDKELASLESEGVISPVESSDWGSPLVVIPKPDGGVRLCVDYKCGVNSKLVSVNHPIRKIDEVLHSLRNSRFFCKLDLYKAYLHLKVDERSSLIQTITTHKGTFKMNRLSFGIKTAPAEFNRVLTQVLHGLSKTEAYFDDIIVHGSTQEECSKNLVACLQRLLDNDLHLNKKKCSFFKERTEYLGHVIEFNRISKSPDKVRAVMEMKVPTNVEEVRRFLGLVTFYARFIPDFSTKSYPLRRLLRKNQKFEWTSRCQEAFLNLKEELCSDTVLTPFDPALPLILTTDASPHGIAAVLSHEINGSERPIAYASRALTPSETNYSQLDREALAIVFGTTHFYDYIFGRNFVLFTDNAPLSRIFHQHKALPRMTSARLLRYASFLSGFDYTLKVKKGEDNKNADCLSRNPVNNAPSTVETAIETEVANIYQDTIFEISSQEITFKTIADETSKDQDLNQIMNRIKNQPTDEPFTIFDGVIFRQDRVLIPATLRKRILEELHSTHIGMMKMKQLARRYVYWPRIDSDIEDMVKRCEQCAKTQSNPPKAPLHSWEEPRENWERLHIDYAGPMNNHHFLICMDAKSKWAEVRISRDAPSTQSTIKLLEDIFSTHGYPTFLVSDNATIFTSDAFKTYSRDRGIFQKFIAPGHPATNGLAERNVQTLKRRLKAAADDPTPIKEKIQAIMLRYKATPLGNGKSPAELYLQRRVRIRLDAIKPHPQSLLKPKSSQKSRVRSFSVGERVQVRVHINNKDVWQFGTIESRLGDLHYSVILDAGRRLKRHVDQMRSTLVPKKVVTFAPDVDRLPQQHCGVPIPPDRLGQGPEMLIANPNPQPQEVQAEPEFEPRRSQREKRTPDYLQDYVC